MDFREICSKLSLKEKIQLCSGADSWHTKDLSRYGLPAVMMSDGPHGLRCQKGNTDMLGIHQSQPATCFPTAVSTACSWDPKLLEEIGGAIAEEAKAEDVCLLLGPGSNIKRDPLCGRNFEYFSEDPLLAGKLAAAFIRGVQSKGVGTSLKHFALNNQEYRRFTGSSQVDERTMREIYLAPFETAVKEGKPATVMCSYNRINGVHASDDRWLLTELLREEWGFEGMVVTDWGAMNDRIAAMKAGCDLLMPGGSDYMERALEQAVESGALAEEEIDRCVFRILRLMEQGNALRQQPSGFDQEKHHVLARKAAAESAVLLKNEDGILPVSTHTKLAVIGVMAEKPRYQGAGSSHINPFQLSAAKDHLSGTYAPGCLEDGSTTDALLEEAVQAAAAAEVAVVFAGLPDTYESEGFDRADMSMPQGHLRLIDAVCRANANTVVVLSCGSPVECPWAGQAKAILYLGLSGQAGGEAAADLIYGRSIPSGKLAESWPISYADCVTSGCYRSQKNPQYREGIYVGYRYYDKAGLPVRWPFGHGLSYTTFAYSDLEANSELVKVTVRNIGAVAGSEVVQLYIAPPQTGIHRPFRELKAFRKIHLQPGEEKTVEFSLNDRTFAVWKNGWKVPAGEYTVFVGGSSRDLPVSAGILVSGVLVSAPEWQKDSWYEQPKGCPAQEQWELLYGPAMPDIPPKKGSFTMDDSIAEMQESAFIMKVFYRVLEFWLAKPYGFRRDYSNPGYRMMLESSVSSPLRSLCMNGGIPEKVFLGLLQMANGHFLQGMRILLKKADD